MVLFVNGEYKNAHHRARLIESGDGQMIHVSRTGYSEYIQYHLLLLIIHVGPLLEGELRFLRTMWFCSHYNENPNKEEGAPKKGIYDP
jgi:hypothetical protein